MSRRSYTTLTLSVRIPVAVGHTQKETVEAVQHLFAGAQGIAAAEVIVKIEKRETTYL